MNSKERRTLRRMVKAALSDAANQPSQPMQNPQKNQTELKPPKPKSWFQRNWKTLSPIPLIASLLAIYAAFPSWSLTLPSSAYRPRNPFTAVFTITNLGLLPGTDVQVQCFQNLIKYAEPKDIFSGPLLSDPTSLGTIYRNNSRTFSCPQVVSGIKFWHRVLTPEEVRKEYAAGKKIIEETGHPPGEDMPFIWADFSFKIRYSSLLIPHRWTDTYRVVGKPGQDGAFVWEIVPPDKVFPGPPRVGP
jgi:hypothetical protein